jgi:hypothetical protein
VTPDRWQRIAHLYEAARARAPQERAAFLAEACNGDTTLLRDVTLLLEQPTASPSNNPTAASTADGSASRPAFH